MDVELSKKQGRKMTIFACLLSVISIGLLVFGFVIVSSEKVVMLQSISNLTSKLDEVFEMNQSLLNNMSTSKDIRVLSRGEVNILDEELANDFSLSDNQLFHMDLSLIGNDAYFFTQDLTPQYYDIDLESYFLFTKLNSNDYDKVLSLLKDAVRDQIDNQNIEKKKVTITYHGKEKRVNELTYEITNQSLKNMVTTFINYLKKDKTLLEHIATTHSMSTEEVTNEFDLLLKSFDSKDEQFGLVYRIYYYGFNKIVRYELETINHSYKITYQVDDREIVDFYHNDINVFSLEISKSKKQSDFTGFILNQNEEKISFNGNMINNTLTITFHHNSRDIKFVVNGNFEQSENTFWYQGTIKVSEILGEKEKELIMITYHIEYLVGQNSSLNLEESTSIQEISEEEINTIQDNWLIHPFYQLMQSLKISL